MVLHRLIDTNIPPETNAGFEGIDDFMKRWIVPSKTFWYSLR